MKEFVLTYGDHQIPYAVDVDPNRSSRVAIHVNPDGTVNVDAPDGYPDEAIKGAVQKRARWVVNHVSEANQRYAHVKPKEYVSGEQVLYLGRRYVLKIMSPEDGAELVKLRGNRLEVQTDDPAPEAIRAKVRAWYKVKGRDYFARRLGELTKKFQWVSEVPPFRLVPMSRQWGSCTPKGEIVLNPHLVKAPRQGIDYVLVHELAHLKHHDHGAEFWKLVDTHVPEWRRSKHHLDGLVELLLSE